jgi:hypothetical protein
MASDAHAVRKIKPVCGEALDAGVEVKLLATSLASVIDEPGKKGRTVAAAPARGVGDEVVDVERAPPREVLQDTKATDSRDLTAVCERREHVALCALASNSRYERILGDVRTELGHHRMACAHTGVVFDEADGHPRSLSQSGARGASRSQIMRTPRPRMHETLEIAIARPRGHVDLRGSAGGTIDAATCTANRYEATPRSDTPPRGRRAAQRRLSACADGEGLPPRARGLRFL